MNIQKGITLFINNGDIATFDHIRSLVEFLGEEYNFLNINFSGPDKVGVTPHFKLVNANEDDLEEKISKNLFRLDGILIHIQRGLRDWNHFYDILKSHENLIIFVVCPNFLRLEAIPHERVVFRQIIEVGTNPDWYVSPKSPVYGGNPRNMDFRIKRFFFRNILTEEEFYLDDFKKTYIRDRKIDNFLDESDNMS